MAFVHWLLDPITWLILVFIVWMWAFTKEKKKLKWASGSLLVILIFILIVSPVPISLIKSKERGFEPIDISRLDTTVQHHIMVLGAGKVSDPELPSSTQLNATVLARLVEGVRIYRLLPNAKLISSANAGQSLITQAKMVADAAVELGVSRSDSLQLLGGYNTQSEARTYFDRFGTRYPLVLGTSAAHMERAVF